LPKLVAYYALADSNGVELDTQRRRVLKHTEETQSKLIAECFEHLIDKRADINELNKAVGACKTHDAKLVIAHSMICRESSDLSWPFCAVEL